MSNPGQAALGIVGSIVGFVVGGPAGAAYGLQIGLAVGTVVSPTQLPGTFGPRLTDQRTTTAQLGAPIAEVFGIDVVAGQVIWLGDIVEHANTEEVGGKGGPEGENTTFSYTQSIAIGLCRGPQLGVLRIWENGKLVYDARPQLEGESDDAFLERFNAAADYAEGFTLYLGDEEQLADPTIELKEGVGNVPAYRGLMYIVYHDRELQNDQGQRHPSFKFEVAASPLPDLRQADAESLRHSFILRAGESDFGGDLRGYSNVPFQVFGELFSTELIGEPDVCEIVGGYTANVRQCLFGGAVFPPLSFLFTLDDFFYKLVTQVEFAGPDFLGTPTVFDAPTSESTGRNANGDNTFFEQSPVAATPFTAGEDYLVTVTSVIPAGRLSFGAVTAATVSPLGAPVHGFNSGDYTSSLGAFGSFEGTIDVGEVDEVAVLGFYVETAGGAKLHLVIDGEFAGLKIVVRLTGENGPVIFGPYAGTTSGSGVTLFQWDCQEDMLASPTVYDVEFRGVGVVPADAPVNLPPTLANIVQTLCDRCGLGDLVEVDDLQSVIVHGYKIERLTDARSAIAVLRQIGFFDAVESGGVLKFVRRGAAPVRILTAADLGAHEFGQDPPVAVTTKSTQDVELPRQLFVQYRDPDRDYQDGQQASPTRLITDAVNDTYVDVAVAIDATQALRAAAVIWADAWAGRWQHSIVLDAAHADLEPTDVVLVPVDGFLERMRIVSAEDSAVVLRSLALIRDDDGSYVSAAVADPPAAGQAPMRILAGTLLLLLDLPPLRSSDNDGGVYAAARRTSSGNAWSGAAIYRGLPGGALTPLVSVTNEAVAGTLTASLPAGVHTVFDDASVLRVELLRGQFESRPDADLLTLGANTLAVGAHGRWELLQFGVAAQVGPTSWELSHLLRGRRGTERNIGTALAGDGAVLVSGVGIVRLPLPAAEAGGNRVYRGVTLGATLATGTDQTFASAGETLRPFSPVHVTASDVGGDTLIEWTRRDRLAVEFTDPLPLSELSEAYEVDILADSSPPAVLRTLSTSTPSALYTAAQRLDDFGSPGPSAFAVRIYQIGLLGRGTPAEAMI